MQIRKRRGIFYVNKDIFRKYSCSDIFRNVCADKYFFNLIFSNICADKDIWGKKTFCRDEAIFQQCCAAEWLFENVSGNEAIFEPIHTCDADKDLRISAKYLRMFFALLGDRDLKRSSGKKYFCSCSSVSVHFFSMETLAVIS